MPLDILSTCFVTRPLVFSMETIIPEWSSVFENLTLPRIMPVLTASMISSILSAYSSELSSRTVLNNSSVTPFADISAFSEKLTIFSVVLSSVVPLSSTISKSLISSEPPSTVRVVVFSIFRAPLTFPV